MVQQRQKRISKLDRKLKKRILNTVLDIVSGKFSNYDFKKLSWFDNLFRIRIGNIRIVFEIKNDLWYIKRIDFRWDVYK